MLSPDKFPCVAVHIEPCFTPWKLIVHTGIPLVGYDPTNPNLLIDAEGGKWGAGGLFQDELAGYAAVLSLIDAFEASAPVLVKSPRIQEVRSELRTKIALLKAMVV